jgi:hypothetical protein
VKSRRRSSRRFSSTRSLSGRRRHAAAEPTGARHGRPRRALLHARGELEVDVVAEVVDQQVGDDLATSSAGGGGPRPARSRDPGSSRSSAA